MNCCHPSASPLLHPVLDFACNPFAGVASAAHRLVLILACITLSVSPPSLAARDTLPKDVSEDELVDITLPALNVSGEWLEDFGLRVSPAVDPTRSRRFWRVFTPVVDVVLPNTAASKAGLQPGDRIVASDGQPTASGSFSIGKWRRIQEQKWAEVAAGKKNVTWTLEVQEQGTGQLRTLKLRVPAPAPHWGAKIWQPPADRPPAAVPEQGPLAERAKQVLDNGISILLRGSYVRGFALPVDEAHPYFLCYQWTLWSGSTGHRIYVSQRRGRTDIILEAISKESSALLSDTAPTTAPVRALSSPTTVFASESRAYLTSPSGVLERGWRLQRRGPQREIPPEQALEGFEAEMDFWLTKVGKVSPRWPLGVIAASATSATEGVATPLIALEPPLLDMQPEADTRAPEFLKLATASPEQLTLFNEAMDQLAADEEHWAYTETAHTIEDKRVMVKRVDPSQSEAERCTLVQVDGRPPTADEVKQWREQGHDSSEALGEMDQVLKRFDRADVRIAADNVTSFVFELPIRNNSPGFREDKFQALFRVNKASRTFETITVKLRESIRMAGSAKLTEAGLTVEFENVLSGFPPQPVLLRGSGVIQVLLGKVSQDFEARRTDFKRVEPYTDTIAIKRDAAEP